MAENDFDLIKQKPHPNLVLKLEGLLAEAKTGELKGMVYALVWSDDQTTHAWSIPGRSRWTTPALIGEMFKAMTDLSNNENGIETEMIK